MYVQGHEVIIMTVIFLALLVAYINSRWEVRILKRDNCIGPDHNWFADYQERAYMCRRCGKWEGMDD